MKNKAFLSILEQLCMILIFAIAAAVCLRVYSLSNDISKNRDILDQAAAAAQYTAELLKSSRGDYEACGDVLSAVVYDDQSLTVLYSNNGIPTDSETDAVFSLTATGTAPTHPLTESAQITVTHNGETVFALVVVWQTERSSYDEKE